MSPFGCHLRQLRLRAGLGLRAFAVLLDERPSTVSAVEQGLREPWRTDTKLRRVSDVLGVAEGSPADELLWDLAKPSDMATGQRRAASAKLVPLFVANPRNVDVNQSQADELVEHLQATLGVERW